MSLYQKIMEMKQDPEDKRTICLKDRDGIQRPYYFITNSAKGKLYSPVREGDLYSQQTVGAGYLVRTAIMMMEDRK